MQTDMIWDQLRGHREQIEMFRRSIGRNRLAQAYLFLGPLGIGKRRFADMLAQCLFCTEFDEAQLDACGQCPGCKSFRAGAHPDFVAVGCPEGKRELPIELFVGIREQRGRQGLCHELALKPMAGRRKVAIIDDADLMNEASANAILKTLEEPPPDAVVILIAANSDSLLPTIRSRCQPVRFFPLSPEDVAGLLLEHALVEGEEEARAVAELSEGSLATARQVLDPQLRALRKALYEQLAAPNPSGLATAAAMIHAVEEVGGDSAAQRQTAGWVIRFAVEFFRQALHDLAGSSGEVPLPEAQALSRRLDADSTESSELLAETIDRLLLANSQLDQNVSVPLCLEALFDDLSRMLRGSVRA